MCYVNGIRVSKEEFIRYKQHQKQLASLGAGVHSPARKGFDYGDWPIIRPAADADEWNLEMMEWGFLPPWLSNEQDVLNFRMGYKKADGSFVPGFTTLNAIGEEILLPGKMFRDAALHRRCLVLSSGFYEHRHVFRQNKRTGLPLKTPAKYPYRISIPDRDIFFMAGIWQPWINRETGEVKNCFAIVTTEANALMQEIHNSKMRMPVVFDDAAAEEWTSNDLAEERIRELARFQYPASQMKAVPVKKQFLTDENPEEEFLYPDLPAVNLSC